jgi:TonB-linked SusC/RagA family outer membrane protein
MKQKTKLKLTSDTYRSDSYRLRIILWSVIALLACTQLHAQNQARRITGKVTQNGIPVASASISVKGTTNATTADDQGNFSIMAATGETLVISSIGFIEQQIKIGSSNNLNVVLKEDYTSLSDVVVVGYGSMKKTDLSSSQLTVTAGDLARTINTSLEQGLEGRAANVVVTQNSGQPGAAPSVIIRGLSSITGNTQPLYVIDGVQIRPVSIGTNGGLANPNSDNPYSHPAGFSNLLSNVNPSDIETINILQGPAATAIYGSVGGNGVILITTKKGKAGETKVTLSTLLTIQDEPKHVPLMNLPEYARFRNEMSAAGGTGTEIEFSDPSVLSQGTDWQKELYRKTLLQKHELALSGGSEKTTFYMSGEFFDQNGVAAGSGFRRYSTRLNLENQARNWLKVGMNITASQTKEQVNTMNGGIIQLALQQNPSVPVKNPDGSWGGPKTTQFQYTNPVMIANIYNDYNKSSALIGGIHVDIKLPKGFAIYGQTNGSIQHFTNYQFHPSYQAGGFGVAPEGALSTRIASYNFWWSANARLQYDATFGKHTVSGMAGHEAQAWGYEFLSGTRKNFITNVIEELVAGDASSISNVINNSRRSHGAQESYFGRVNYIYNDKYILQGTIRADGSSRFGEDKRWGYFPAVSVAWRVSQEEFMKSVPAINDLKLRMEYGLTGNQNVTGAGIYAVLSTVPTTWGTGFLSQNFNNPLLQWETDKTFNIGFDLHMLKNRIEIIFDAYTKNLEDLLTVAPDAFTYGGDITYSPGYLQWPSTNVGAMRNRGFGITVNTVNIDNRKLMWRSGLSFSVDRAKITKLKAPINPAWGNSNVQVTTREGDVPSLLMGYIAEGLFQDYNDIANHAAQTQNGTLTISPTGGSWVGDIKFKDMNKDGKINQLDRVPIGNPWPKFTFGLNNSFTYGNFDLNFFFTGVYGNDVLNVPRYNNEIPGNNGTFGNYYKAAINFARPSSYRASDAATVTLLNPGYRIPRIYGGNADPNGNLRMSQWFIEDGSYIRLKNITLGYTFPSQWMRKAGLRNMRASISAQNLFTITSYKGFDPEVGMLNFGGTIMAGVDPSRYPSVRFYSFSLTADF